MSYSLVLYSIPMLLTCLGWLVWYIWYSPQHIPDSTVDMFGLSVILAMIWPLTLLCVPVLAGILVIVWAWYATVEKLRNRRFKRGPPRF